MKMKTCQACDRRRPRKKLNVSCAQHFREVILCKNEESCTFAMTGKRVPVKEVHQKMLSKPPSKGSLIFKVEYMEVAGAQYHQAMHLLLNRKSEECST